jgi:hypothetical protein
MRFVPLYFSAWQAAASLLLFRIIPVVRKNNKSFFERFFLMSQLLLSITAPK